MQIRTVTYVPLARLLAEADVISLNASLNETTLGLIDGARSRR